MDQEHTLREFSYELHFIANLILKEGFTLVCVHYMNLW